MKNLQQINNLSINRANSVMMDIRVVVVGLIVAVAVPVIIISQVQNTVGVT